MEEARNDLNLGFGPFACFKHIYIYVCVYVCVHLCVLIKPLGGFEIINMYVMKLDYVMKLISEFQVLD